MHAIIIHSLLKNATELPHALLEFEHMKNPANDASALCASGGLQFHDEDCALVEWASQHQVESAR